MRGTILGMALPRPARRAQLAVLRSYIAAVAEAEQITETEVKISIGMIERTPWGVSNAHHPLTRASVAAMIHSLRNRVTP
jgi:hypothetical protein